MDKNMDIKDLFKKFKSGGAKDARKGGKLNAFFEKNPKMKYILPAIVVLISVAVAAIIIFAGNPDTDIPDPAAVQGQEVAVLPQIERHEAETLADEGEDPFEEDILANARVTGMIYNFGGYWTATIATKDNKNGFTVQVGDYVGSSDWYVESIDGDTVVVTMGDNTRTIEK